MTNTEKKRVLIINPSSGIGGAEKSLKDVLTYIADLHTIFLIIPANEKVQNFYNEYTQINTVRLIRLRRADGFLKIIKNILQIIKGACHISRLVKLHDIDIIYSNTLHAHLYSILVKCITGKKLIWHVRDNVTNKILSFVFSAYADKIICVSDHILHQIKFKHKAIRIYNGIDIDQWPANADVSNVLKDELGINRDKIIIAHIGQLIPWKRHDLFIDVAKYILNDTSNVHFVIIGYDLFNDFPDYKKSLHEQVLHSNLSTCFSFIDFKDSLRDYLCDVDILLHLAHAEPFGRILIEAMALAKPVVALNSGGPAEIVSHNKSGFLLSDIDPEIIAEKVKLLIHDGNLRMKFGQEGRKIVTQKFSIANLKMVSSAFAAYGSNGNCARY